MKYWVSLDFPVPPVQQSRSPSRGEREQGGELASPCGHTTAWLTGRNGRLLLFNLSWFQSWLACWPDSDWLPLDHCGGWRYPARAKTSALEGLFIQDCLHTCKFSINSLLCFWLLLVLSDWMQCPLILCLQSNQQALLFLQGSTPATARWHRSQASSSAWRQIRGELGMVR